MPCLRRNVKAEENILVILIYFCCVFQLESFFWNFRHRVTRSFLACVWPTSWRWRWRWAKLWRFLRANRTFALKKWATCPKKMCWFPHVLDSFSLPFPRANRFRRESLQSNGSDLRSQSKARLWPWSFVAIKPKRRCGGLRVRVPAFRSPVPGSNLFPGPPDLIWGAADHTVKLYK